MTIEFRGGPIDAPKGIKIHFENGYTLSLAEILHDGWTGCSVAVFYGGGTLHMIEECTAEEVADWTAFTAGLKPKSIEKENDYADIV